MLFQGVQELAQVIADDGLGTGVTVGVFIAVGLGVLMLVDRVIFILQDRGLIPKKAGNPNGLEKVKEIHEWYVPKNVGEKPPAMSWLPIEEFMAQQEKSIELLEKILAIQEENK